MKPMDNILYLPTFK